MNNEDILKACAQIMSSPAQLVKTAARQRLINFARYVRPEIELEPFHVVYYTLLDKFAHGEIKKMIAFQSKVPH